MSTGLMLETALRRDRLIVAGMLAVVFVLAWAYLLAGAGMDMGAMEGMPMSGMSSEAAMAPAKWSFGYAVVMFFMWWIMMIAMMVPSAARMILLFSALHRKKSVAGSPHVPTALFLTSYLVAWAGFSLVATILQWALARSGLLSLSIFTTSSFLGGAILIVAGLYQLTPIKQACLAHCSSPIQFLATHWRPGYGGAFRMGLEHGTYCVGCCWFLMLLLFFGGVMNLYWIAGLAAFVWIEKLVPARHWLSYATGVLLTAWGSWLLLY